MNKLVKLVSSCLSMSATSIIACATGTTLQVRASKSTHSGGETRDPKLQGGGTMIYSIVEQKY